MLVARGAVRHDQVRDLAARRLAGDAVITTRPEMSVPALVMNCLAPLITHSPSSSRARVSRVAGVRAGLGLGQPERARALAAHSRGSHSLLLLLGAEQVDRLGAERGVGAQRDRDRRVDARQLLDRDRVRERVAAGAPVLLRERDPHQARARRARATIS